MKVIVWIVEGTWPACVDAVRTHAPAGLLGRGHPERDPGIRLEAPVTLDSADPAVIVAGRQNTLRRARAQLDEVAPSEQDSDLAEPAARDQAVLTATTRRTRAAVRISSGPTRSVHAAAPHHSFPASKYRHQSRSGRGPQPVVRRFATSAGTAGQQRRGG